MKLKYFQILAAFVVGLLVPCLVMRGIGYFTASENQQSTESTGTVAPVHKTQIHVLDKQGITGKMDLEEYLVGVILAEMPTNYEMDALCAQAVVARTYAIKRQGEQRHFAGAICFDPGCCQAYVSQGDYLNGLGYQEDIDRALQAVQMTEGTILTYEGAPIEATYFSCSGGRTEAAVAVWGADYPYLQSVMSPGEEEMKNYRKEVYFTQEALENALGRSFPNVPESWIGAVIYTEGGSVNTIEIAGTTYTGQQLRTLLKLNSTAFTAVQKDRGILITTSGKGHRVGMSQSGAQAMALRGYAYPTILTYYYPGAVIDKLENIG